MSCHHRKELGLLQKLYGLYDTVMNNISAYYDILWAEVDIEKINAELVDFQNRYSGCGIPAYRRSAVLQYVPSPVEMYTKRHVWTSRCRKLPKGLKDWQAFLDLKKRIDDFSESCPLLEMMANKAMKQRHWDRITDLTGHTFEVESDTFSLQNIMEAPLLKYKEDIEVNTVVYAQYMQVTLVLAFPLL